jgi:uncharacterized iron-regulated membrane protein
MFNLASGVLASGGHGGRRITVLVLLLVIVAIVAGWILYARRARRNRNRS